MTTKPTGAAYWRSLDELEGTPELQAVLAREFPGEVWETIPPATRRQFLKVMGASLALAGLTSCRWPREEIVPMTHRPAGRDPGVPQRFATAMEVAGVAAGLVVTSYDGRPIKIEGNPKHPASLGAASAIAQASLLELYDPDRSRAIVQRERGTAYTRSWERLSAFLRARVDALRGGGGRGLAVLSEATSSVTVAGLRHRLEQLLPEMEWYEHEVCSRDAELEGLRRLSGRALRPVPRLEGARVVACFDADPLLQHPDAVRLARELAAARRPGGEMVRLWVAEPIYTVTGGTADHRLATASRRIPLLLAGLAAALGEHGIPSGSGVAPSDVALSGPERVFVEALAADLAARRGAAVLLAGPGQPAEVHALTHAINLALGAEGTLRFIPDPGGGRRSHAEAIATLAHRMDAGEIDTLLILGGNPAYDAPADLELAARLRKVPYTVRLGEHPDETSALCGWHVPRAHYLESWSDARSWDGTLSVVQPLIEPLYGGKTPAQLLAAALGEPAEAHGLVRRSLRRFGPAAGFESYWKNVLREGVVPGT
ncbi:MAG: TAT-variant-translocated molybdopterin oxidoreductase, partial [Acidobacteria bacterium]|nr:TAT-variant-translocated molybdopterin oxidoreductase [Acidobacteriota bacterium]